MNDEGQKAAVTAVASRITVVVSNIIKLGGVYLALRTAIVSPNNAVAYATSAFMMAGAQFSESAVLTLVERLLGQQPPK